MADDHDYGFRTTSLHAGQDPDPATRSRAPPIYQTTSYVFEDTEQAADLFALEEDGDVYSRLGNPTNAMLEDRLAQLENAVAAVATSSGMAALDLATLLLAKQGENVVSADSLFGNTYTYLMYTAPRRGVETRLVETLDYDAYEEAIDEDTAYVHLETIGNPSLDTPDIERVADIAHDHGVPLLVDNTWATPELCRPLDHGADLVWESTTKWLHGSGTTLGGILAAGGSFPWEDHAEKYPEIAGDNPAYHGLNFRERFEETAFVKAAKARGLRDLGNQQSAFDAWVTLQKLESFPLRMRCHCETAAQVAEFLDDHDHVSWVTYPGLEDHETHDNAGKYLEGGFGSMLTFGVEGGREAAMRTISETELVSHLANIGDAKTLVIHPASTTHQQLSTEEQREAGVTPDMIRLSVGIENPEDVAADLDRALRTAVSET